MEEMKRCGWARGEAMVRYHDEEWGIPLHDDARLFELLLLEGFQAGLSWAVVLNKREAFRRALDGFDAPKIAAYDEARIEALLQDESIIRSRRKLRAAVRNARAFLEIQRQYGSFDAYLWRYTGGSPLPPGAMPPPASTPLSEEISRDLKKRGMQYVGPVIIYSFMQAAGLVNDHEPDCFRAPTRE